VLSYTQRNGLAKSPEMSQAGVIYRSQDLGGTWQRFDYEVTPHRTMMSVTASHKVTRCV